jgi:UDP-N-acetylglucosamine enolpyruvyl transferase
MDGSGSKNAARPIIAASLLAQGDHAVPGGCAIGARPIDPHLKGLAARGVRRGARPVYSTTVS